MNITLKCPYCNQKFRFDFDIYHECNLDFYMDSEKKSITGSECPKECPHCNREVGFDMTVSFKFKATLFDCELPDGKHKFQGNKCVDCGQSKSAIKLQGFKDDTK